MTLNEIIERLEYFRKLRKITARELSLRIGKHETYINKLECTDFNLPLAAFLEILKALNVGLDEFFAINYTTFNNDKDIIRRLQAFLGQLAIPGR